MSKKNHIRKLPLVLFGLFLVLVRIIVPPFVALFNRKDADTGLVKKAVTAAYLQAEKSGDETIARQVKDLSEKGIIEQGIASSKADVCYFERPEAGTPLQKCYLRYVDGFTISLDQNSILQKYKMIAENYSFFTANVSSCEVDQRAEYKISPAYLLLVENTTLNPTSPQYCVIPNQIGGRIIPDEQAKVSLIRSFDPKRMNYSSNHIWIVLEQEYYREELVGDGLFGSRIRKIPITAR